MAVNLSLFAGAGAQFLDNAGNVLTGGKIFSYLAGTTTPQPTYTDFTGITAHTNPIILDASGRVPSGGEIWLTEAISYKFILRDTNDVLIATYDNITGNNSGVNTFIANLANTSDPTKGDALVGFRQSNSTGNLVGAVGRTVHQKLQESVSVLDFGADPTGATDSRTAIQAALDSGADTVHLNEGTYLVSGQLTVPLNVSLIGEGRNATTITSTVIGSYPNTSVVHKSGSAPTIIPDLSANVVKAQRTLSFVTSHGLNVGDVILIYNPTDGSFNSARTVYRSGEYCTVSNVLSSTQVGLENGLYDSYIAANVDVYKCGAYCSGTLKGFTAIAPGPGTNGIVRAINVSFGHKIELEDLGASNSDNASFSIDKCYKVTGRSLDCFQWNASPGFGTQYGLSVANSQELDLTGSFVGFRHGIAFGGGATFSIPNRSANVHDFFAKSSEGTIAAADWHGNCEWCVYENGQVFGGGLNIAGNNNRITGIKALGDNMMLILGREILGCNHVVENVECYTGRNDTRAILNIGSNEIPMNATNTRFGGQYVFRNIQIDAPNNTGTAGIGVRNRGFVGAQWDVIADNIIYNAPESSVPASDSGVSIGTVSGDPPYRVQATNITVSDNINLKLRTGGVGDSAILVKQDGLSGRGTVTTTTAVQFVNLPVTFAKRFAKTPSITANASQITTGGDNCAAFATSPTELGFNLTYARVDTTGNFTAALDRNVNWQATLQEW
jgi:hypothetical protein